MAQASGSVKPYARALLRGSPWPSTRQFYRRRALRILPAYLVFLACIAALSRQYTFLPG
jgi:peptidoglycan/LPS O-acetylase OafA/YrhL